MKSTPTAKQKRYCAVLTALLWWLAGAGLAQGLPLFALGWIALTPFLFALTCGEFSSLRARFFFGWKTGLLCFALLNWWMIPTLARSSVFIGVPSWGGVLLSLVALLIIGLVHGFSLGLVALIWRPDAKWFSSRLWALPVATALFWLGFEWLRSCGQLGHTWGALAFTQVGDNALLQSVAWIGQHGLSALCFWFAASLALWLGRRSAPSTLWQAPLLVLLALHCVGAMRLLLFDRQPSSKNYRVLVNQTVASSLQRTGNGFDQAQRLTTEYFHASPSKPTPDLIVWPETTLSMGPLHAQKIDLRQTVQFVASLHTPLLTGTQRYDRSGRMWNEATLLLPDGTRKMQGKMRLVPFGERAPFLNYLPLLAYLSPRPGVTPAMSTHPLEVDKRETLDEQHSSEISLGTVICFESCFPVPAKTLQKDGAQVLIVLTNDEWFAGTEVPAMHAAMSVLRAVETGLPLVQCANGGDSIVVDARGRVLMQIPFGQQRAVAVDVPIG